MEKHIATLRDIDNLERIRFLTKQSLAGSSSNMEGDQSEGNLAYSWFEISMCSCLETSNICGFINNTNKTVERAEHKMKRSLHEKTVGGSSYSNLQNEVIARAAVEKNNAIQIAREKTPSKRNAILSAGFPQSEVTSIISKAFGCVKQNISPQCSNSCVSLKYRHITGACNNRNHQSWGASNTLLTRWLPSQYEDGIGEPKGWNPDFLYNDFYLPPVREVTKKIIHASNNAFKEDDLYSHIIIEWGQYMDHDIAFTPQSLGKASTSLEVDCKSTCENQNPCYPIKVSANDSLSQGGCIPFYRSSAACGTGNQGVMFRNPSAANPREQINGLTSFIDASTVYGSTAEIQSKLRNLSSDEGLLQVNLKYSDHGREYMPFVDYTPSPCIQDPKSVKAERIECFLAGESRSNEVISLAAMHTLWLREHNRVAKSLKELNPQWNAETTYQEARKIVGALHQIITVRDYIPKILGPKAFVQYIGQYGGYNETMNPSISNIFSTAAFRFGHATIPPIVHRLDSQYKDHPQYPNLLMSEVFFRPWRIIKEGGLDPLFRGLLGKSAKLQTQQEMINEELTEKLQVLSNNGSMDLASLNLQRGRDHGLPGYNDWREFCGLPRLSDMTAAVSDKNLSGKILALYGHPDNVDVWLGGLAEDLLKGGRTGPLFACLIGKQMKALREGDRFWYENEGIFTRSQRAALMKHSLSRVICDNTGLTHVPQDVFLMGMYPDDYKSCDIVAGMNLQAWKEPLVKGRSCGLPRKIENGDFVFCSEAVVIYICHHGFRLEGHEELTCLGNQWSAQPPFCSDINECEDPLNSPCHPSAKCRNTLGSFQCQCTDPYELAEDKRTCVDSGRLPKASVASIILVAVLFVSWAAMGWILLYKGEALFRTSAKSLHVEDAKKLSIVVGCSPCDETSMSSPSFPYEQIHKFSGFYDPFSRTDTEIQRGDKVCEGEDREGLSSHTRACLWGLTFHPNLLMQVRESCDVMTG
ncbi:thyroid peroxidase [Pelodytes ibericus]